jgi:hypothetical protein
MWLASTAQIDREHASRLASLAQHSSEVAVESRIHFTLLAKVASNMKKISCIYAIKIRNAIEKNSYNASR